MGVRMCGWEEGCVGRGGMCGWEEGCVGGEGRAGGRRDMCVGRDGR